MSDRDRTPDRRACGGDVAAYALGALDPAEAEEFRRHLDSCVVCRDELRAFAEVVNTLPLNAPAQRAPASLKRNVMREVRRGARPAAPARRFWVPAPVLALGTALVLAVIVVVGLSLGSSSSATRVLNASVTGSGTAQLRITRGRGSLVVRHFAAPPAGKIYEVWLKRGNRAPSPTSALFSVTRVGSADVDVPGSLNGVSLVMVTPEPAGGSQVPTHAPVLTVSLT